MTREEFVEKYRHELFGVVADAMIHHRTGPELSQWMRVHFTRIEQTLAEMYDAARPAATKPTKG